MPRGGTNLQLMLAKVDLVSWGQVQVRFGAAGLGNHGLASRNELLEFSGTGDMIRMHMSID
jgi:hypothetical protein